VDPGPEAPFTLFCTRCGHPNRDDARQCTECGHPLQGDATLALQPTPPEEETHPDFPFPHDELAPRQALLAVRRGPNAGTTFLLESDESSIGRDPQSAVFLDDVTVSRKHAALERRDGGWYVRDRGSLNGTYVNGEQVDETKLATGDELQIGTFKLTFFQASA
jgi:pSer/pThr/pTyr-binding forkhead associated (FHA) protein